MPDKPSDPCSRPLPPLEELEMSQVEFWLHIMHDHAMFIKEGLPCEPRNLREEAQRFYDLFGGLIRDERKVNSDRAFREYIRQVGSATADLCQFKNHLLHLAVTCQLQGNHLPALLLAHVRREAAYFLSLLAKMEDGTMSCLVDVITHELSFWVDIMKEHLAVNDKLLDPAEEKVHDMLQDWLRTFTALSHQSRALQDILANFAPVPDLMRLLEDVQHDTAGLRDFQTSLGNLISQCRLLQIMPPHLVMHQNRETEHFLHLLGLLQETIRQQKEPGPSMTAPMSAAALAAPLYKGKAVQQALPEEPDDEDGTAPCAEPVEKTPAEVCPPAPVPAEKPSYVPSVQHDEPATDEDDDEGVWKPGKYKWSGHWPRPLGKQPGRGRNKKK